MTEHAAGPRAFVVDQWPLVAIWSAAILVFGVNIWVIATRIATTGPTTSRVLILGVLVIALVLLVAVLGLGYRHYARTAAAV
jgi:multisubunit Na+/H+ antiporter MnhF subunit